MPFREDHGVSQPKVTAISPLPKGTTMTTRARISVATTMLEDMQLRGLSARTQEAYTRAVWQLGAYYHRSPAQLSDEDLRQYFLYLANEKKLARPTTTSALCGIKFFHEQTLKQPSPNAA